jgi:tripartite-type tricarboxylate transporter receptor subunit TctC
MKTPFLLFSALLLTAIIPSHAAFPDKPVHYIVPFAPGTESDTAARLQQAAFQKRTGQRLVIQSFPGAAGAMGWDLINKAKGDGYTLISTSLPDIYTQPLEGKVKYKTDDLQQVYIYHYSPDVLVVDAVSPYKNYADLTKAAKDKSGGITVTSINNNAASALACGRLNNAAGVKLSCTTSKSHGEAMKSLSGANVTAVLTSAAQALAQKGKVHILAIATDKRHPAFPNTPTFKELGVDWVDGTYRGLAVPAATPPEVRKQLSGLLAEVNKDADYRQKMALAGFEVVDIPVDGVSAFMADKAKVYGKLAKDVGMGK